MHCRPVVEWNLSKRIPLNKTPVASPEDRLFATCHFGYLTEFCPPKDPFTELRQKVNVGAMNRR